MALISKASLLMVPSTYEPGTLYNVLPSGNRAPDSTDQNSGYDQTRADFDFDRGSNAAATRVNSDGLIEKYRENVLTYSNSFNQWSVVSVSLTGGQSGYDGSNNAWLFNSSAGYIRNNLSLSGVYTYSIYAKQGTADGIRLRMDAGTDANVYISLTDGSESFSPSGIDYTATNVGDGWWRISVTQNDSSFSNFRVYAIDASGGSTTGTIYIQDAQVERSLVPTGYLETTTTTTGKAGVLVDLPRINFDANGENGSLLLEPSRANLVQFSEYFSTASGYWINVRSTIETNSTTSPEGLNNASKILQDSTTTNAGVIVKSITASGSNTFSFFAKKGSVNFARLSLNSGTETSAYFDLENGEVGTTNSISESDCFIEDMGNDWYRCGATYSGATNRFNIYLGDRDGITTLLDASNAYIYIYGAQWEASASYPSSYIPNHGESGGVTRAADSCSVTGASDVIGQTEGTLFVDMDSQTNGGNQTIARLQGGTAYVIIFTNTSGNIYALTSTGGLTLLQSGIENQRLKISISYKANDYIAYVNGVQKTIASSASTFTDLSEIYINRNNSGGEIGNENLNQLALFKERLSNAELATLTTL